MKCCIKAIQTYIKVMAVKWKFLVFHTVLFDYIYNKCLKTETMLYHVGSKLTAYISVTLPVIQLQLGNK